jgi:membrane-associated PAP2 superfamily phosphatase
MPPRLSATDRRWLAANALFLAIAALALLAAFDNGTFDLAASRLVYDFAGHRFPWQHHWLFEALLHRGMKTGAYALGIPALILCIFGMRGKLSWLPPRNARLAAAGMVLVPLATAGLKQLTNRHCPWDIIEFGGFAPYVGLLAATPVDLARGICFPAGHASGGFAWLAWVPALWITRPVAARRILYAALIAGSVMGLARLLQGAHFLSHVLWSAWLAWAISITLTALLGVGIGAAGEAESLAHREPPCTDAAQEA